MFYTVIALLLLLFTSTLFADEEPQAENGNSDYLATAHHMLTVFRTAYPDKVDDLTLSGGDWSVRIGNRRYFWAEGRLLSGEEREKLESFTRHPFYPYSPQLPELIDPDPEQKRAIEARIARREENPPTRNPGLYNAVWRVSDKSTAWDQVKTAFFFGKKTLIHRDLLDELASIEEELQYVSMTDQVLREYLAGISKIEGFSWRPIAGTASLSYHSYGAAIDFLSNATAGKEVYWRWARDRYPEWYILPYEKRFSPPEAFIRAFEKRGFIWGGKWFYFDTMHFEYRPEILAVNGYTRVMAENPVTGVLEPVWIPPSD